MTRQYRVLINLTIFFTVLAPFQSSVQGASLLGRAAIRPGGPGTGGFGPFLRLLDPPEEEEEAYDEPEQEEEVSDEPEQEEEVSEAPEQEEEVADEPEQEEESSYDSDQVLTEDGGAGVDSANADVDVDLVSGQATTNQIWKERRYFFAGQVGDKVTLTVTSRSLGLDLDVALQNPQYKVELRNGPIRNYALKMRGRYTVIVTTDHGGQGNVEVRLQTVKAR